MQLSIWCLKAGTLLSKWIGLALRRYPFKTFLPAAKYVIMLLYSSNFEAVVLLANTLMTVSSPGDGQHPPIDVEKSAYHQLSQNGTDRSNYWL